MSSDGGVLVIGGTRGIGKELARSYAGDRPGDDPDRADRAVRRAGRGRDRRVRPRASAWISPDRRRSATALASVGPVKYLAIVAIERDENTIRDFNIDHAIVLVTLKLVGFAEVVHVLLDRLAPTARSSCSAARRRTGRIPARRRSRP